MNMLYIRLRMLEDSMVWSLIYETAEGRTNEFECDYATAYRHIESGGVPLHVDHLTTREAHGRFVTVPRPKRVTYDVHKPDNFHKNNNADLDWPRYDWEAMAPKTETPG